MDMGSDPWHEELGAIVHGLLVRFRLRDRLERRDSNLVLGAFAMFNGGLSIGLMALGAYAAGAPLVFPSLGPTAFLLFYLPRLPMAAPRNVLGGHLIGLLAGFASLSAFGLLNQPAALLAGVTLARVGAAAVSLGATAGLTVWLRVPHPPAAATTLLVSLGVVPRPIQLFALFGALVMLVSQGIVVNRLAGIDYPLWAPRSSSQPPRAP
jgi:CBS domain-containing membrane protein